MGNLMSQDLAGGGYDLRQALAIQLQSNHYPPVPLSMIDACISALDACIEEENDQLIELPEGVSWRGQSSAPAWSIVEAHHLEAWLYEEEE